MGPVQHALTAIIDKAQFNSRTAQPGRGRGAHDKEVPQSGAALLYGNPDLAGGALRSCGLVRSRRRAADRIIARPGSGRRALVEAMQEVASELNTENFHRCTLFLREQPDA